MTFFRTFLFFLLISAYSLQAQVKPRIHEVQVIKFDNYDNVDGEQKIYHQIFPKDTLPEAPIYDAQFAIKQFNFPPPNDTLRNILNGQKINSFKSAEFDEKKRIKNYFRNAKERYEFEYNSLGNLQYVKRWGAKHVTAQITFIYLYY